MSLAPQPALEIRQLIKTKVPRVEFHRYQPRKEVHFRRLFAMLRVYLEALDRGKFTPRLGFGGSSPLSSTYKALRDNGLGKAFFMLPTAGEESASAQ